MNIKKIKNYQIFSVIFTFIIGTLLHFTYNWYKGNPIVAIFSSVNESVWEHLKLLFFPMLFTTIIGNFHFKKIFSNFLCSKTIGIIIALSFTIIFFYTYTGILGNNIAIIDISSFFLATILGELVSYLLIINKFKCNNILAFFFLIIFFIFFLYFTHNPPNIGLFLDPLIKKTRR